MNSILWTARELGLKAPAGHTMKFLGCICHETKCGKEKGNLKDLSKKVNFMSEILARLFLRNEHLRKPHDKQIVTAKWRGIWREKCTKLSKRDLCSDEMDTSRRRSTTTGINRGRTSFSSRSDKHACGKPMLTDLDKQATGNREPAYKMLQTRCTRSNARHS